MNEILVTIVVPVYNVEKYIKNSLESIVNQTYKNIEILIINDGSKDCSIDICEGFADKDKRIKIISQKNGGLSAARNTGIDNATGEYICFIDSDDFIDVDYVKLLLEDSLKNDSDISACNFYYIDEDNNKWIRKEKQNKVFSNIEAIKDMITYTQDTEVMTWNKLYKTKLFKKNNIYFPVGKLHEDNFTTYKLYYYSNKISLIPNKLYYYLQRKDSIMGSKFNIKRLHSIEAVNETKKFLEEKEINLFKETEFYEINTKINLLNNMLRDNFNGIELEKLINDINKNKRKYLKNSYLDKKMRISLMIFGKKGQMYRKVLSLLDKLKMQKRS